MNSQREIQDSAVNKFLKIIYYNNPVLGKQLYLRKVYIFDKVVKNIQSIGVTDYAKKCLAAKELV